MFTNKDNISLSLALWLAHDHYEPAILSNTISVTTIIKSLKQIILGMRITPVDSIEDISDNIANRIGTAIHSGIEDSWLNHKDRLMKELGYPDVVIKKVKLNPTDTELKNDNSIIPIYMEQRSNKLINGFTISGKFDFVIEGKLEDFKTTSVYTWIHRTGGIKHSLQGSIYRWLNQDKITSNKINIQYLFKDWKQGLIKSSKNYPPKAIMTDSLNLLSIQETEEYVRNKTIQIKNLINANEDNIPPCSSKDLWRKPSIFKYYKNPANTNRSTKNFDNITAANTKLAEDGGIGIVKEVKGSVVACRYCKAFNICEQKDEYLLNGTLII